MRSPLSSLIAYLGRFRRPDRTPPPPADFRPGGSYVELPKAARARRERQNRGE